MPDSSRLEPDRPRDEPDRRRDEPVHRRDEPVRVVVVADDLIWAARLADAVTAAGGVPVRVRRLEDLFAALADAKHVIVDLTARAYDGRRVVAEASARARVLAVGQHDDLALRKAALAAGAERVLAYRKLFEDGPGVLRDWLGRP